jgi:hypothetical protein
MPKKSTKKVYRSAYSGKFVSKKYTARKPRETVTEHIAVSKKRR